MIVQVRRYKIVVKKSLLNGKIYQIILFALIFKKYQSSTINLKIIIILKVQRMSDDLRQMMTQMMQQMQQQQFMINKLTHQLAEEKHKNKSIQQSVIINPNYHTPYTEFQSKSRSSSMITKTKTSNSSKIRCPENHYSYKIYYSYEFCNNCSGKQTSGKKCMVCNYKICRKCEELEHSNLCGGRTWKFYDSYEFCLTCGGKQTGGKRCKDCGFNICLKCEQLQHQFFCKSRSLSYYNDYLFCWGCGGKQTGGKKCNECGYRHCAKCQNHKPI